MTHSESKNGNQNGDAGADSAHKQCPTCAAPVDQSSKSYPFCSRRCRLADLNKWFSEDYKLSRPIEQSDIEEGD